MIKVNYGGAFLFLRRALDRKSSDKANTDHSRSVQDLGRNFVRGLNECFFNADGLHIEDKGPQLVR